MKKALSITLILVLALLASCGNSIDNPSDTLSQTTDTSSTNQNMSDTDDTVTAEQTQAVDDNTAESEVLCTNDDYTITLSGNQCYIQFATEQSPPTQNGSALSWTIEFASIQEMKQAFINNTLTAGQLQIIHTAFAAYSEDRTQGIDICNLEHLYEAIYPDELTTKYVSLSGRNYVFYTNASDQFKTAAVFVATTERYESFFEDNFTAYESEHVSDVIRSETQFDGISCEMVEYKYPGSGAELRDLLLETTQDGVITKMLIRYRLSAPSSTDWRESDTLPAEVWIFREINGEHFMVNIDELNIVPTVEWLSSFGVTPYVDNTDHVAS